MISLGQYNIVLGIPSLRNHNPDINWKTDQIYFINYRCLILKKELYILQEYINKQLKKGIIKILKLLAGYRVLY